MESQPKLNFPSPSFLCKRETTDFIVDGSCSVGEDLITSANLNVYATYQQQGTSRLLAFGRDKRVFEESIEEQQSKKSKPSPDDEIFITSSDINVRGTFQPSLPSQLYTIDSVLDMTDDLVSPSNWRANETNLDVKNTLITSADIDTRCNYQQHLCNMEHSEFNSFEKSSGTDYPDFDISQEFHKNIFWTTPEDIPGYGTEYRTVDHSDDFIGNNLGIVNSMLNNDTDTSFSEDQDSDLDSYRCISCNHRFHEFFQLMSHVCLKSSSFSMPSPVKNPTKMAFFSSTRKDLASYLSISLPRICEEINI